MYFGNIGLAILFLLGSAILTGISTCFLQIGRVQSKEAFRKNKSLFFFQYLLPPLFRKKKWEGLFFTLSFAKHVLHLCYAILSIFILLVQDPFLDTFQIIGNEKLSFNMLWVLCLGAIIITISLSIEMLLKFVATVAPHTAFKLFAPLASLILTIFSPITALLLKTLEMLFPKTKEKVRHTSLREKILEVLYESDFSPHIDPQERKLILSIASFKERIAREIMVPRIDVTSLPDTISLKEAVALFLKEGYSRIPIYKENVDQIVGVLLYKDVFSALSKQPQDNNLSIKHLIKPVIYTPEIKKISLLLQEFKTKQIHLAIVIDEYGGTEGILTIEDILEELVGEISDEFDSENELLYSELPGSGWIVDARMSILDIEKELGVRIPASTEYDTIGGYIFHKAGAIPGKGWRVHHDNFDLEILSSDDRSIEKIKITPLFEDDEE